MCRPLWLGCLGSGYQATLGFFCVVNLSTCPMEIPLSSSGLLAVILAREDGWLFTVDYDKNFTMDGVDDQPKDVASALCLGRDIIRLGVVVFGLVCWAIDGLCWEDWFV